MARPITFPKVHVRHWKNAETDVMVEQGSYLDPLRYKVYVPSQTESGWAVAAERATLAEARRDAQMHALAMREQIAAARDEAYLEYAADMANRADRHLEQAAEESALTSDGFDRVAGYMQAAWYFVAYDPGRSLAWSRAAIAETDRQRETVRTLEADHAAALIEGGLRDGTILPMANGKGYYPAAAQEHLNQVHRGIGNLKDTMSALHEQAWHEHLAREWYAHAGFESATTAVEVSAGRRDWDDTGATPTERVEAYEMADLTINLATARSYLAGGWTNLALLAAKDTYRMRRSERLAEVEHTAQQDGKAALTAALISSASERGEAVHVIDPKGGGMLCARNEPAPEHGYGEKWSASPDRPSGWVPLVDEQVFVQRPGGKPVQGLLWVVKAVDREGRRAQVDLIRGSLLGPQWEPWTSLRPAAPARLYPGPY